MKHAVASSESKKLSALGFIKNRIRKDTTDAVQDVATSDDTASVVNSSQKVNPLTSVIDVVTSSRNELNKQTQPRQKLPGDISNSKGELRPSVQLKLRYTLWT